MIVTADTRRNLRLIKLTHTAAWAVFAAAILAIPVVTWMGALRSGLWLSLLVLVEVAILSANRMQCPLTSIAAGYTNDRSDNFDIYLPLWLAKHNKLIFGSLFVVAEAFLLWRFAAA
ncbi:MAG: hypothetical protein H0T76_11070 [Nannocystis sp.]|nr:hypothetical protein [Nannocystis sp.]MBA3547015.1 hypothetical protein [Nannocystis sp.]